MKRVTYRITINIGNSFNKAIAKQLMEDLLIKGWPFNGDAFVQVMQIDPLEEKSK